ncbi:vascular endothelial growth factor A-like isoform 3-T3 [Salvelinus alpinus]|uniref:snake venom vascular endothelial growth factor-like isoform X3 n=1 Tax=Salvelinus alpinus TaxID=8036 RepID=UPI0039FCE7D1
MTSHSPVEPHSRVMLFREVLERSLCRSMERLVEVEQEYPGGVEYIFSPACVPLWRCAGCCGDENLECHPTLTRNVTMQLMRITPTERTGQYVELTFVEHQTYTGRCILMRAVPESGSIPGGGSTGKDPKTVASVRTHTASWILGSPSFQSAVQSPLSCGMKTA